MRSCDLSCEGESCREGQESRERELVWGKMLENRGAVNNEF
jgi:hypothetical protein